MDDERIESILKLHTRMPPEKWEMHKFSDVWISAEDAVAYGFGVLGDFSPTLGTKLYNIWPPQN
jgi:ATP-dependent Clp protease protease subunit